MQPSFETPTDTMTVSLNVRRVRKRRSDACMRSGGGYFEHMQYIYLQYEQADNIPGRHLFKLNVIAPYLV